MELPDKKELSVVPLAMCCVLSEIRPSPEHQGVSRNFVSNYLKTQMTGILLNAKVRI